MSYVIKGEETPLERSSLNPKIRGAVRNIEFTNNKFQDSHTNSSVDFSHFSETCSVSIPYVEEVKPLDVVHIPSKKNMIINFFGSSLAHIQDFSVVNEHVRLNIDVVDIDTNPHDGFAEYALLISLMEKAKKIEEKEVRVKLYIDEKTSNLTTHPTDKTDLWKEYSVEFPYQDFFVYFKFKLQHSSSGGYELTILDQNIDGSRIETHETEKLELVHVQNRKVKYRTGVIYPKISDFIAFHSSDSPIEQPLDLVLYKSSGASDSYAVSGTMFKHDLSGYDSFELVSHYEDFEYDVELIYSDRAERIEVDLDFIKVKEPRVYHNFCFLKEIGNETTLKNITKEKASVMSLSYE